MKDFSSDIQTKISHTAEGALIGTGVAPVIGTGIGALYGADRDREMRERGEDPRKHKSSNEAKYAATGALIGGATGLVSPLPGGTLLHGGAGALAGKYIGRAKDRRIAEGVKKENLVENEPKSEKGFPQGD